MKSHFFSKAQTKERVSAFGYTAIFKDDEIEVRRRSDKAPGYFTNDRFDAIQTAKKLAEADFTAQSGPKQPFAVGSLIMASRGRMNFIAHGTPAITKAVQTVALCRHCGIAMDMPWSGF